MMRWFESEYSELCVTPPHLCPGSSKHARSQSQPSHSTAQLRAEGEVTWVDPEPDLLTAAPSHALTDQVALEVAAQLPGCDRGSALAEHRLHKVLRAGRRGQRAADHVGVVGVGDGLVGEDVLVHAPEERRRRRLGRAVLLELVGDDESCVAGLGVVLVRRQVLAVLVRDGRLNVVDVRLRAGVDVDDEHLFHAE
eukprot:1798005-Rhodomonas_salina.1